MKFGVDVPTCLAGMAYPVPFATADEVVRIAVEAEQLGYHEVSGNDHLSTQRFVREAWPQPPDYFEPLMMLATIAAKTSVVRLGTGILVLPMREPVLLAKQIATLDHISGGRVTLAVAAGGYRDEFESVVPDLADASRVDLMAEGIESLRVLFEQPRSTYEGKYRRFVDVESYPKPVQNPLPIFSGGNGKVRCSGQVNAAKAGCPRRSGPPTSRQDEPRWRRTPGLRAVIRPTSRSACNRLCALRIRRKRHASVSSGPPSICFAGR
jgi:alkanesulfonate monooxygenase SsuD/methylene tetrahydromethanopterin reductase-like flavin-dependent oxidoreductase (luciferase family)